MLKRGEKLVAMTPEIRSFFMQPAALIITKADVRATVHRRAAMDYVGVKLFDTDGELTGELSIVGLFTSSAYTQSPSDIPLLRRKLQAVVAASGFNPAGHSGKALINVLETYPRDELFQIDADTLGHIAQGILQTRGTPAHPPVRAPRPLRPFRVGVRVHSPRPVQFGGPPADRRTDRRGVRRPGGDVPALLRGRQPGARHFIILRHAGKDPKPNVDELEQAVVEAVRTWDDRLAGELARAGGALAGAGARWRGAFPAGYRDRVEPRQSLKRHRRARSAAAGRQHCGAFPGDGGAGANEVLLRLYHHGPAIPLSGRLPILENMGFRAIEETTFNVAPEGKPAVIHDVLLTTSDGAAVDVEKSGPALAETFMAVWKGEVENDAFNALTLRRGIAWRDVAMLRALRRATCARLPPPIPPNTWPRPWSSTPASRF